MPFTPLHLPVAYLMYLFIRRITPQGKNVSLPGLMVGSVFADLEILFAYVISLGSVYYRVVLHSLLGAATIGTFLSVLLVVLLYPSVVSYFFSIEKQKIQTHCRFSLSVGVSCLLGNISHALLDLVNHDFNTIFWPFIPLFPSPISFFLGGALAASFWVHLVLGFVFLGIIIHNRHNLWENLFVGE